MAYTTIDDPSAYFHTQLFTGTGSSQAFTNDANAGNFQPDWLWIKQRNDSTDHGIFDSSRGVKKNLKSNGTDAESTENGAVTAFGTDGFTVGNSGDYNGDGDGHVAWQWKANGGTTTTNAAGANGADHESVFQANDTAGFSIVTYTSDNQSGDTIMKHGLSRAPTFMIHKGRNADSTIWWVFHEDLTLDGYMNLNSTGSNQDGSTNVWRNTAPTSSVFKVGLDSIAAANGRTMVAYCFAPIQGYSKFGKFTGTADADGPFIHTGFKPAWLMIKEVVSGGGWGMWDNKRNPFNAMTTRLLANTNAGDDTSTDNSVDFLSNGFKMRTASGGFNQDGAGIVYMAFAESPFVSSEGIPTTAR